MEPTNSSLAPIAVFCYNRLEHLHRTVDSLRGNFLAEQSSVYFFSDGWKDDMDRNKVEIVRNYLHSISGFKTIAIIENENNMGLANSVIKGVSELIDKYGKIIVVEDDLYLSPYFLTFMNQALCVYEDYDQIGCVNAHSNISTNDETVYYISHTDSWGWGTWKRAWDLFNKDGSQLLKQIEDNKLKKYFNFDGSYPYFRMLQNQIEGKNDSWAIRWKASLCINGKLSVNAAKSMVDNIGCDGSGTHCSFKIFPTTIYEGPITIPSISTIKETKEARKKIRRYYYFYNSKVNKGIRMLLNYLVLFFNHTTVSKDFGPC